MRPPRRILLFAWFTLLVGSLLPKLGRDVAGLARAPQVKDQDQPPVGADTASSAPRAAVATGSLSAATGSDEEVAAVVRDCFRREQLQRELTLEQQRFGPHYWSPECNGRERAALEAAREAMRATLTAEANALLAALCPHYAGPDLTLPAFFDAAHPGPNLSMLTPAQRDELVAAILGPGGSSGLEADALGAMAERVLPAATLEAYRDWNDPAAARLRNQLVGFDVTEFEFVSILYATGEAPPDDPPQVEQTVLADLLGPARYAAWCELEQPAQQDAAQDLWRLGLPLTESRWLATVREKARAEIDATWRRPELNDGGKRARVAELEQAYGRLIAQRLGLPVASLDGIGPGF